MAEDIRKISGSNFLTEIGRRGELLNFQMRSADGRWFYLPRNIGERSRRRWVRRKMIPPPDSNKLLMQGIHVELTPAMQERIRDKFDVVLSRSSEIVRVHVHLHLDQKTGHLNHFTAKGRIEIGGPDLLATAEGADAYGVIDGLADKLDHLLERRHGMKKERRHRDAGEPAEI